jgi:adenylate cyclase
LNNLSQFWQELKRRKVIRVVIVYAAAGFAVIEFVDIVTEPLNLPEWALTLVIILVAIGFPFAIIFAWIFDITAKGIKKTEPAKLTKEKEESSTHDKITTRFENSIAVLPFEDMSPHKDQEYFCDGMSEELINALTHVEKLKVIARTSAFAYKGKQKDMREIGKKLGVETLLEGSIRKDGKRLRITAQLIKASDGSHIWSEAYNRELKDVFAIQEELSLSIVDNLKVKLLGEERKAMLNRHTDDLEAFDTYLMATYWMRMGTPEGISKAFGFYEHLIKKHPNNPMGYIGLASVNIIGSFFANFPPNEIYPKSKELLNTALNLDDNIGEVHAWLGLVELFYNWNWDLAEDKIKQALELAPNSATTHEKYSYYFRFRKQYDAAIAEAERALELDPVSIPLKTTVAETYFYAHQFDKAIDKYRSILTMAPDYSTAHYGLAHAYEGKSMFHEAIKEYEKAVDLSDGTPLEVSSLAGCYYMIGEKEQAEKLYNNLLKRTKTEYIPPVYIYSYHMIREDYDQAFEWLEKAIDEHDSALLSLNICPTKGHRIPDEPRFKELWRKMGLEI